MPKASIANACLACAKSKRRCGRQTPSCATCSSRGRSCVYPTLSTLRSDSTSPQRDHDLEIPLSNIEFTLSQRATKLTALSTLLSPCANHFEASSAPIHGSLAPYDKTDWFLAPETWLITRAADSTVDAKPSEQSMMKYFRRLQSWLERWVANGSNPFIHARLHEGGLPTCVQVAYTTLAAYHHRTAENAQVVLKIIEDQARQLLQANGAVQSPMTSNEWSDRETSHEVDPSGQLARLHALMAYQIIGLLDGDIRARHVAEGRMAILDNWAHMLLDSAATAMTHYSSTAEFSLREKWYMWIQCECIRRAWLVAVSISPIYTALQQHWAACPGGIMYTDHCGLWDTSSAVEWHRRCWEIGEVSLRPFQREWLVVGKDTNVDEFGMAMIELSFDAEAIKEWKYRNLQHVS